MNPIVRTVVLLTLSNVFMTFAWYAVMTLPQLKILQEVITLCILAAVYFVFRKSA